MTDSPERALELAIEKANQPLGRIAGELSVMVSAAGACLAERQRLGLSMAVVHQAVMTNIQAKVAAPAGPHFGDAA
jgi:hypothetical protein